MKALRGHERDGSSLVRVVLEERGSQIGVLNVKEDTTMVDGLGGGIWDGSMLIIDILKDWLRPRSAQAMLRTPIESSMSGLASSDFDVSASVANEDEAPYVCELGAGTGLLGMVAYAMNDNIDVCVTDRYSDLLSQNITEMKNRDAKGRSGVLEWHESIQSAAAQNKNSLERDYSYVHINSNNSDSKTSYKSERTNKKDEASYKASRGDNNASPKRSRSHAREGEAQDKSPSEEQPRKRLNSVDPHSPGLLDDNMGAIRFNTTNNSQKGRLTTEELTWTVKPTKSETGYNPAPTSEEMSILYTPLPGSTYANTPRYPDLILGAEIAVLQKQQQALVSTISRLAGPKTLILLTADDLPAYPAKSKYERNLDEALRKAGFLKIVLSTGRVMWQDMEVDNGAKCVDSNSNGGDDDYKSSREAAPKTLPLPPPATITKQTVKGAFVEYIPLSSSLSSSAVSSSSAQPTEFTLASHKEAAAARATIDSLSDSLKRLPLNSRDPRNGRGQGSRDSPPPLPGDHNHDDNRNHCGGAGSGSNHGNQRTVAGMGSNDNLDVHHVNAYFKPSLLSTCARCHAQYFNNPRLFNNPRCRLFNPHIKCRYHPQYYVCRFHPAELGNSGDGLGYYGNGQEGYHAKFWDCCGAEEESAQGCMEGVHIAY